MSSPVQNPTLPIPQKRAKTGRMRNFFRGSLLLVEGIAVITVLSAVRAYSQNISPIGPTSAANYGASAVLAKPIRGIDFSKEFDFRRIYPTRASLSFSSTNDNTLTLLGYNFSVSCPSLQLGYHQDYARDMAQFGLAAKAGVLLPDDDLAILMGLRFTYVQPASTKMSPRTFMTIEFVSPDAGFVLGAQAKSKGDVPNPLGEMEDRLASVYYSASTWTASITAKQNSLVNFTYTFGFEYQILGDNNRFNPSIVRFISSVGLEKPGDHVLPALGMVANLDRTTISFDLTRQPDPSGNDFRTSVAYNF